MKLLLKVRSCLRLSPDTSNAACSPGWSLPLLILLPSLVGLSVTLAMASTRETVSEAYGEEAPAAPAEDGAASRKVSLQDTGADHDPQALAEEFVAGCWNSGCDGFYEELIKYIDIRENNIILLVPETKLREAMGESALCQSNSYLWLDYGGAKTYDPLVEAYNDRILRILLAAKALGAPLRLIWQDSGNGSCSILRAELRN